MTANLSAGDVPRPCYAWLQATGLIGFKCVQRSASDVLVDYKYASFELLSVEGGGLTVAIPTLYTASSSC